jgi:hypothetical protein
MGGFKYMMFRLSWMQFSLAGIITMEAAECADSSISYASEKSGIINCSYRIVWEDSCLE